MRPWVTKVLFGKWWATLLWMGLSAVVFALMSYNIIVTFQADIALVRENGYMALMDGVAAQLLELFVTGLLSLVFYILFKACEHSLIGRLTGHRADKLDQIDKEME